MANELRFTAGTELVNGNLTDSTPLETLLVTQSVASIVSKVVSVTTSEADLSLSEITTPGWALIKNLDPTNYVQYGPKNAANNMQAFARLKPGELALLRLEPSGVTLRWVASTATCKVLVKAFND